MKWIVSYIVQTRRGHTVGSVKVDAEDETQAKLKGFDHARKGCPTDVLVGVLITKVEPDALPFINLLPNGHPPQ